MIRITRLLALAALLLAASLPASPAPAAAEHVTLASTTSTEQSGLFGWLIGKFREASGIDVRVVAVGTGQALKIGERGDADALLVHDPMGEAKFMAEGFGSDLRPVMVNDFVIVGPAADPAAIRGLRQAGAALERVHAAAAPFASRGDDSGTHRLELRLWRAAGISGRPAGGWYRELGQGMGPTLNTAAAMDAYALTDRATWAAFRNRQNLELLVEGDPALLNPYSSILVNPELHPHVNAAPARRWHEWLTSAAGRAAIASFRIDGQQVFFPTSGESGGS
ncbi:MAG TPA: substrate-binding domain-containing protein [Geminicoccaceae bacterium]|nr:substrate-binding domain-containing protein [Geminicoccaceae bacterium]